MKAQSYGKYDVFNDETATTWEEAEAMALKARGMNPPAPEPQPKRAPAEKPKPAAKVEDRPEPSAALRKLLSSTEPEHSEERALLNRALILLIHLRERVFKESPEVEKWVNDILAAAKGK